MSKNNVFRDGRVYVCARLCDTCIFRPGNVMDLQPGRVEQMVSTCIKLQGVIPCHETTDGKPKRNAVCRGFFERHRHDVMPLELADRLGYIEWQNL